MSKIIKKRNGIAKGAGKVVRNVRKVNLKNIKRINKRIRKKKKGGRK